MAAFAVRAGRVDVRAGDGLALARDQAVDDRQGAAGADEVEEVHVVDDREVDAERVGLVERGLEDRRLDEHLQGAPVDLGELADFQFTNTFLIRFSNRQCEAQI